MRFQSLKTNLRGMTVIEVLIVVAVLLLLAAVYLPSLARPRHHPHLACVNDLKQIGLAFKIWAGDNQDKYPMQISVTNGGSMEWIASGTVFPHFQVMSNELSTPRILFCPQDTDSQRQQAIVWGETVNTTPPLTGFISDSNTSYFVGVDASDFSPIMPLSGDRNITLAGWALNPGLHSLPTNAAVGWSERIHIRKGNILLSDGSVHNLSSGALPGAFHASGVATNRLAIP